MAVVTRRGFLGLGALIGGGIGCAGMPETGAQSSRADDGREPDLVLINGRVYTIDAAQPRAEAFAVKGGRFVAIGSTDDVENLIGPNTEVIDASVGNGGGSFTVR